MYTFIQLKFAIGNNFIYITTADVKSSLFFSFWKCISLAE